MTTFQSFNLPAFMLDSLAHMQISSPTPIQESAIPLGLAGHDILASAQTGTGKTLAYLIPIINSLMNKASSMALILTPTRELAMQVRDSVVQLIKRQPLQAAVLIGGEPIFKQFAALKRQPRIIIGTPGRICDHLNRKSLKLQMTEALVLDETDRMLDMGFSQSLEQIMQHVPKVRQTFMFSATLPTSIIKLSQKYLTNPQRVAIGSTHQPVTQIKQEMIQTAQSEKFSRLLTELNQREGSVIIFVKTKISADQIADRLNEKNHNADAIHGDLKQRQRDQVIRAFRQNKSRILVATDIAARGIDIPHIKHVINYDLPQCPEDYIHRIGRTGRAGMEGSAVSLVTPSERHKWKAIHRLIYANEETPSQAPRKNTHRFHAGKKFAPSDRHQPNAFKPRRASQGKRFQRDKAQ